MISEKMSMSDLTGDTQCFSRMGICFKDIKATNIFLKNYLKKKNFFFKIRY